MQLVTSYTLAWGPFFELLRSIDVPDEFMAQRELNAVPASEGLFDAERGIVGAPYNAAHS